MPKKAIPTKTLDLSSFVKTLAKQHRVSLRQIAKEIDITPSYLSEVLTGKKRPSPRLLGTLAEYFKIPKVDVYNAAGWLSLNDNEQLVERFKDVCEKDPNFMELFEILLNLPEMERRRNVRLLLALTKDRTEEPPLGWTETLPDGTVQTYMMPGAQERDEKYNKKNKKSGSG